MALTRKKPLSQDFISRLVGPKSCAEMTIATFLYDLDVSVQEVSL
jgi:hypothetical protein